MTLRSTKATTYLVEQYLPHATEAEVEPWVVALAEAATAITATGTPVRSRCSILVPDDDLCFHVLAAASPKAAARAAELAGITPERTIEATAWWPSRRFNSSRKDQR
jgi:hypothetical protein